MGKIIIGLVMVVGGLSGKLVLRGTSSGGALAVFGAVLILWGIVKLVHVLGDKRDHFGSMKDVWEMFRVVLDERKRREHDPRCGDESTNCAPVHSR